MPFVLFTGYKPGRRRLRLRGSCCINPQPENSGQRSTAHSLK